MRADWILPAVNFVLLAAGLGLCLYLFFTLKCDMRTQEKRAKAAESALTAALAAIRMSLDQARTEVRDIQEQTGMLVPPSPAQSGLNISKRGQALQMYRRGQAPEQIAASLSLPVREIDLLIKVHQIVLEQIGWSSSGSPREAVTAAAACSGCDRESSVRPTTPPDSPARHPPAW